jgi:hypothetical protein
VALKGLNPFRCLRVRRWVRSSARSERWPLKPLAEGSNPSGPASGFDCAIWLFFVSFSCFWFLFGVLWGDLNPVLRALGAETGLALPGRMTSSYHVPEQVRLGLEDSPWRRAGGLSAEVLGSFDGGLGGLPGA